MSLVSEFLQKVGLIRNETQYHGNTKERVADTFETLFNLDVWFKKLDPQDPNANKIYQADGTLIDLESGGELKKIGNGYGLQHQIDNPNNYGTLGNNAVNFTYSNSVGDFGATGSRSHAEGSGTTASGVNSHAEGNVARASGANSHAEGLSTTASGGASHAEGHDTTAGSYAENARGCFNEIITPIDADTFNPEDVIESVGVGINTSNRKNALTRWKNGAFKWLLQPLTNITNAALGFHAADENGRLNYHDGSVWKPYMTEIKETNTESEIKFWTGTQAEYDSITTKDTQTLYIDSNAGLIGSGGGSTTWGANEW